VIISVANGTLPEDKMLAFWLYGQGECFSFYYVGLSRMFWYYHCGLRGGVWFDIYIFSLQSTRLRNTTNCLLSNDNQQSITLAAHLHTPALAFTSLFCICSPLLSFAKICSNFSQQINYRVTIFLLLVVGLQHSLNMFVELSQCDLLCELLARPIYGEAYIKQSVTLYDRRYAPSRCYSTMSSWLPLEWKDHYIIK